jgi:hypothetical protein
MNIMMPSEIASSDPSGAEVLVNVFHGAEGDEVRARIVPHPSAGLSPKAWALMAFDPQIDPLYQEVYDRERGLSEVMRHRGLPEPRESHHIWRATLPTAGLPAGTHTLEVRHRDLYGVERVGRRTFRVTR